MRMVIVPGIGGSDEEHWQTEWQRAIAATRIGPASWDDPEFDDWSDALGRAIGHEPAVLVAHSLGCLLAVRWAAANPGRVAGLFLVAAPDAGGAHFPRQAVSFGGADAVTPGVPALLIASDDDPYATPAASAALAEAWSAPLLSVGARGHLNSASRLGEWSEGRVLLTAFVAGLG